MSWTPIGPASASWVNNPIPLVTQTTLNIVTDSGTAVLVSIPPSAPGWSPASANSETWTPN